MLIVIESKYESKPTNIPLLHYTFLKDWWLVDVSVITGHNLAYISSVQSLVNKIYADLAL